MAEDKTPIPHTPKVSICIPAYNQTRYLEILLNSIAEQTFKDYEVIVSDDSSTDDVRQMVEAFNNKFPISYIKNKPALGSPENWNAVLQKANGSLVKIMHHDDFFTESESLKKMVAYLENGNLDFVFSNTRVQNAVSPEITREHKIAKLQKLLHSPELTFFGNPIGAPSTLLCKQEIAKKIYYNKALIWLVDVEYYYHLFKLSSKGGVINEPLISTHDSAEHQISNACIDDYELQAKEQLIMYFQMKNHVSGWQSFFMQMFLLNTMFRQNGSPQIVANAKLPFWFRLYNNSLRKSFLKSVLRFFVKIINKLRPAFVA